MRDFRRGRRRRRSSCRFPRTLTRRYRPAPLPFKSALASSALTELAVDVRRALGRAVVGHEDRRQHHAERAERVRRAGDAAEHARAGARDLRQPPELGDLLHAGGRRGFLADPLERFAHRAVVRGFHRALRQRPLGGFLRELFFVEQPFKLGRGFELGDARGALGFLRGAV